MASQAGAEVYISSVLEEKVNTEDSTVIMFTVIGVFVLLFAGEVCVTEWLAGLKSNITFICFWMGRWTRETLRWCCFFLMFPFLFTDEMCVWRSGWQAKLRTSFLSVLERKVNIWDLLWCWCFWIFFFSGTLDYYYCAFPLLQLCIVIVTEVVVLNCPRNLIKKENIVYRSIEEGPGSDIVLWVCFPCLLCSS